VWISNETTDIRKMIILTKLFQVTCLAVTAFGIIVRGDYKAVRCDSFTSRCRIDQIFGQSLSNGNNEDNSNKNIVNLPVHGSYYFSFHMPSGTDVVDINLSVYFGNVEIYAATNREPKASDFDYSSILLGDQDFLRITSPSIDSDPERLAEYVVVMTALTPLKTRVMTSYPGISAVHLSIGTPQKLVLLPSADQEQLSNRITVDFRAPEVFDQLNVVVTPFGSSQCVHFSMAPPASQLDYITDYLENGVVGVAFSQSTKGAAITMVLVRSPTNSSSSDSDAAASAATTLAPMCVFTVTVRERSVRDSTNVVVGGAATPTLLSGIPQYDLVGTHGGEQYFLFYMPRVGGGGSGYTPRAVEFTLDPSQGDADLFVNPGSTGFYRRTSPLCSSSPPYTNCSSTAEFVSQRPVGTDRVLIAPNHPSYVNPTDEKNYFCITVRGYGSSFYPDAAAIPFSVRASLEGGVITVVEQTVVRGFVKAGEYKYYRFYDMDPSFPLAIDLNPLSGDADLLVGCLLNGTGTDAGFPSRRAGHYNFTSQRGAFYEDTVDIPTGDPKSCSHTSQPHSASTATGGNFLGGIFYIAVAGYADAEYTLEVVHSGGVRSLKPGIPQSGVVFFGDKSWYTLRLGFEIQTVDIVLTPEYGDPDLYVRLVTDPSQRAETLIYDLKSNNIRTAVDQVTITKDQLTPDTIISVLVYGFKTSKYTVLASLEDGTVALSNGVPQRGSVADHDQQFYSYEVTCVGPCLLQAVLTALSGGEYPPSLFVSTSCSNTSTPVQRPNSTSPYTYRDGLPSSGKPLRYVDVPCQMQAGEMLYIAVDGGAFNATYTIRVEEKPVSNEFPPTLLSLYEGLPQTEVIHSTRWKFYRLSMLAGHETVDLRLTSITGKVDLFISECTAASAAQCATKAYRPNETSYLYASLGWEGSDVLAITRNDPVDVVYVLGVRETGEEDATYQLSFVLDNSILALQAGVAVYDAIGPGEYDYFSFSMDQPAGSTIQFTLTPLSGDPDLCVSTYLQHPSTTNATWKSYRYGADSITIETEPGVDADACTQCTYYVAVYGNDHSHYTLSVRVVGSTQQFLRDGIPSSGQVAFLEWDRYQFPLHGLSREVTISLTSVTGNANLYVTLDGSTPELLHFDYISAHFSSGDEVSVSITDAAYTRSCLVPLDGTDGEVEDGTDGQVDRQANCQIRIGVFGMGPFGSEYSVIVSSSTGAQLLQVGLAREGNVAAGSDNIYRVLVSPAQLHYPLWQLQLSVNQYSGHIGSVLASVNSVPCPTCVNANASMWRVDAAPYVLTVSGPSLISSGCGRASDETIAGQPCSLTILVHGADESAATYSIVAVVTHANWTKAMPLLVGFAGTGSVAFHTVDYYVLRLTRGAVFDNMHLVTSVFSGSVDVYMGISVNDRP
jgi:hypothetical protein